jgi:hypothetical protein
MTRALARIGAMTVIAGFLAVACGDDEQPRHQTDIITTATTIPAPFDPSTLDGPGTPLVDGFRAPADTRVIGVDTSEVADARSALLLIERSPSAVTRDIVSQAVALGGRWSYPVFRFCSWVPPAAPTTTTIQAPPTPGPSPHPPGYRCDFSFGLPAGEGTRSAEVSVMWGSGAAHLFIETYGSGRNGRATPPDLEGAPVDPEPMVPSGLETDLPRAGEEFGAENNCFVADYARFRVPEGASLVAPPSDLAGFWDFVAFLRTDDPKRTVEDLQAQITESVDGGPGNRQVEAHRQGGTVLWEAPGGDNAGGGGCRVHSTGPGEVVVATHSD